MVQWAAALDHQFRSHAGTWEEEGVRVEDWAWESHELADSVVYAKLPVAIPVEKPEPVKGCSDDNHISTRMLNLHERVSATICRRGGTHHRPTDCQGRCPAGDGVE